MHEDVDSIWNYTNYRVVFLVVFVLSVDMQRLVAIVIIVRRAITRIQPNQLVIEKYANVCLISNRFEINAACYSIFKITQ